MGDVELQPLQNWRQVFNNYDKDKDGFINIVELRDIIKSKDYLKDIPDHVVKAIFKKADRNRDYKLDYNEFLAMVRHPKNSFVFGNYLKRRYFQYVKFILPPQPHTEYETEIDGFYEDAYSCSPPAVIMIIISLVEIMLFTVDIFLGYGSGSAKGPVATTLLYDPHRRKECWRYLSYMFVHVGHIHLIVNIVVQIMLGTTLEMAHKWRVVVVYLAGVLAGSLGTSICDPRVKLAGASGGVYSLLTAHLASIILNWHDMSSRAIQLITILLIIASDVGTAVYNRYILKLDEQIGYAAHFFGALAGLLVGITVLRNITVYKAEKVLQKCALILFSLLAGVAILWNGLYPNYFPVQFV